MPDGGGKHLTWQENTRQGKKFLFKLLNSYFGSELEALKDTTPESTDFRSSLEGLSPVVFGSHNLAISLMSLLTPGASSSSNLAVKADKRKSTPLEL